MRTLSQCRRAFGRNWGLAPKITRWIYTSIVRPGLCYACLVWWPRMRVATMTAPLNRIQRLACICIKGAIRTTPLSALVVMLSISPIDLFVEIEALLFALLLRDVGVWISGTGGAGHTQILHKSCLLSLDLHMRSDHIRPAYHFDVQFKCSIPPKEAWTSGLVHSYGLNIFTDGSCTHTSSGYIIKRSLSLCA